MQYVVKVLKDGHGSATIRSQNMAEETAVISENVLGTDYVSWNLALVSS